jgi:hypothetical protein
MFTSSHTSYGEQTLSTHRQSKCQANKTIYPYPYQRISSPPTKPRSMQITTPHQPYTQHPTSSPNSLSRAYSQSTFFISPLSPSPHFHPYSTTTLLTYRLQIHTREHHAHKHALNATQIHPPLALVEGRVNRAVSGDAAMLGGPVGWVLTGWGWGGVRVEGCVEGGPGG